MRLTALVLALLLVVPAYAEDTSESGSIPEITVGSSADYIESAPESVPEPPLEPPPEPSAASSVPAEPSASEPGDTSSSDASSPGESSGSEAASDSASESLASSEASSESSEPGELPALGTGGPTEGYGGYLEKIGQMQLFQIVVMCMMLGVLLIRMYKR